eukprot:CAMPEP_0197420196 /NCGR_PEP_ID=MMETSP1170-20131217/5668_1 /TAXON_ID=54406 /ORGANISM="Sarcinochrysis sp, Strain CCMP770" /LENGTH=108 /DNA_ID=CAMNT_0042947343 /DNA_START=28 /DNA_END=351 /DNA_ORIENTATION=+
MIAVNTCRTFKGPAAGRASETEDEKNRRRCDPRDEIIAKGGGVRLETTGGESDDQRGGGGAGERRKKKKHVKHAEAVEEDEEFVLVEFAVAVVVDVLDDGEDVVDGEV